MQRRRRRREHSEAWCLEAVDALNEMQAGPEPFRRENLKASGAQMEFCNYLREAVAQLGRPPSDLNEKGALSALLSRRGYTGEPATLAPLEVDLLSLPPPGHAPLQLEAIIGGDGVELIRGLMAKLLLKEEAARNILKTGLRRPYQDERLRDRRRHLQLVARLREAGLIKFVRKARCQVGGLCRLEEGGTPAFDSGCAVEQ